MTKSYECCKLSASAIDFLLHCDIAKFWNIILCLAVLIRYLLLWSEVGTWFRSMDDGFQKKKKFSDDELSFSLSYLIIGINCKQQLMAI